MAERLRQARISAGYKKAQDAIDAFGWQAGTYRHHENGTRSFDVDAAKRYGRAFKINPGWLLALDTIRAAEPDSEAEEIEVVGTVAAGVWQEQSRPFDKYSIKVGPSPIGGAERFAVEVHGRSMDKTIPPGSILECVRAIAGVAPRDGDLVIVERTAHDLTELTCKRLHVEGGQWVLRAESNSAEFNKDIMIGNLDENHHNDNETRVIGIVVRSYQSHLRR